MMINLYVEIDEELYNIGKTVNDIAYIDGIADYPVEPKSFLEASKKINYDDGFGEEFINHDLTIVFTDGSFLRRDSYDGSEWFEYFEVKDPKKKPRPFKNNECFVCVEG